MKTTEPRGVYIGKLHAQKGIKSKERLCVLRVIEL